MTVLIVDDSSIVRRVLKGVVQRYFDEPLILEAKDGSVAMQAVNAYEVDLMLLDWNMPVMDGEAVVKAVRAEKKTQPNENRYGDYRRWKSKCFKNGKTRCEWVFSQAFSRR
jgi:CheY-like chemotaxis protein